MSTPQDQADYADEWMKGEEAPTPDAPATNAAKAAAPANSEPEFSAAFNDDKGPGEGDAPAAPATEVKAAGLELPGGAVEQPKVNAPANFKEAFAQARSRGDRVFEWKGAKYTTNLLAEKAPASADKPLASPSKAPSVNLAPAPEGQTSKAPASLSGKSNLKEAMAGQKPSFMGGKK